VGPFRESGAFFPSTLDAGTADRVLAATREALLALEVTSGVTHAEFKLTADGPRLIEVNGRLGGFVNDLVGRATGVSMVRLVLENALATSTPVPERIDMPGDMPGRRVAFQRFYPPPSSTATPRITRRSARPSPTSTTSCGSITWREAASQSDRVSRTSTTRGTGSTPWWTRCHRPRR